MDLLPHIGFGAPWILLGLIALPAIWFLLRVTPPMPRRVVFPPLRLLLGLKDDEQTPAGTPWWLLLLRLIAAAAVIVALSEPQLGRTLTLTGKGPLVLLIDNGWTAAPDWAARAGLIREAVDDAARANRPVAILATADRPQAELLDAARAAQAVEALAPRPFLASRKAALAALAKLPLHGNGEILWLCDGVDDGLAAQTAAALKPLGRVRLLLGPHGGPLAVTGAENTAAGFDITLARTDSDAVLDGLVAARGDQGQMLGTVAFRFAAGENKTTARLAIPLEMRNRTARIEIAGQKSAGAVHLLDRGTPRRTVGLVSGGQGDEPLLSGTFYLDRALTPYADLKQGTIGDLLDRKVAVLILSDVGKIAGANHERVVRFVENGGLLIRFAGDHTAEGSDDLVPVVLRAGGRTLGSTLSWASPQHLAPFPEASPFAGLALPDDVTVTRQILAEPSVKLAAATWARLADGTPMVTAAARGKGWIVQFHVAAAPSWSTLPLSGLYVEMLRRLLTLSAGVAPANLSGDAMLAPTAVLDGFGEVTTAGAEAQPLRGRDLATAEPSRTHPPGLYGAPGAERALNAARSDTALLALPALDLPSDRLAARAALALKTPLLILAVFLLLVDFVLALVLRGYGPNFKRWLSGGAVLLLLAQSGPARADDAFAMKAALDTRLAYVVTGVADVDAMSKAGLIGLGRALALRTTYAPLEPMGVDLEKDDLSFFPLIYWPMDPREKDLSPAALSKLGDYMRSGGTLLIDTRDLTLGAVRGPNNPGEKTLRRLIGKLDLPPLAPVPPAHVLTKSYYLLSTFPGRWDGGTVWAEVLPPGDAPIRGGDGVSPVIIGGNDWAAAWAVDAQGHPLVDVTPGGSTQREMAIRFGVNLVMYALTGNYKTDQVHVKAILDRLGK